MAVSALLKHEVNRIILTRPAVEAGEKLGYLPGTLYDKINPYLRPLMDAVRSFMLRTLVRDKANLVAEAGDWVRRMQKSLDQMNVRVHRAVSDIEGATGMAMIRAIVSGASATGRSLR